jgi:uncharacterized protein
VKFRIFPREESFFDLFEASADNGVEAARLLLDMVEDFVELEMKAKRLVEAEHAGDAITRDILSRLNSTFITPFDREDIYDLASRLDDVTDAVEATADMLVLHKVVEPLPGVIEQVRIVHRATVATATGIRNLRDTKRKELRDYWVEVNRLENEGDHLYRHLRAELYSFVGEHPAQNVLKWKDIIEELEEALDGLERLAHTVESIVLKNA